MTNSKHYRWQARWTMAGQIARHDSGVTIDTRDGRMIDSDAAIAALQAKHGHNLPAVLDRMQREARALAAVDDPREARL